MTTSAPLDPEMLKRYRKKTGLTQRQLAIRAMDLPPSKKRDGDHREDMYQKIERTGVTSRKRGERIAAVLGVPYEDLLLVPKCIKPLWWISASVSDGSPLDTEDSESDSKELHSALGSTVSGVVGATMEIRAQWRNGGRKFINFEHIILGSADFNSTEFRLELMHCTHDKKIICRYIFLARPIEFDPAKGLLWRGADFLEKKFFVSFVEDFLFRHSHKVSINGEIFPPDGSTGCYQIEATELVINNSPEKEIWQGHRYFFDSVQFYLSLYGRMTANQTESVKFQENSDGLEVILKEKNQPRRTNVLRKTLSVSLGWMDSNEKFHAGPWPISDRKPLLDGQIPRLVRLGFSEDAPIPPFEPDLTLISTEKVK